MRVLVTGGAGFIGSHLVDALLDEESDVTVLDDLSSGRRENLATALDRGATLEVGDVRDDSSVAALVERVQPQRIYHLAAQIDVRRSVADPVFDLEVNGAGTINLLAAAAKAGVDRFVFASTGGAIYGEGADRPLPLPEDAERRPDAPYGQSKLTAEGYIALFSRLHGVSGVALRLGNVYGPRQDPHGEAGVVAIFCGALLEGQRPRVFGDGLQTRDYIFVDDVVSAFLAGGESNYEGALNVGTGREANVLEVGAALAKAYGKTFEPQMEDPRAGEVQQIAIDSSQAAAQLGWRPQVGLEDGLARTAKWAEEARAN